MGSLHRWRGCSHERTQHDTARLHGHGDHHCANRWRLVVECRARSCSGTCVRHQHRHRQRHQYRQSYRCNHHRRCVSAGRALGHQRAVRDYGPTHECGRRERSRVAHRLSFARRDTDTNSRVTCRVDSGDFYANSGWQRIPRSRCPMCGSRTRNRPTAFGRCAKCKSPRRPDCASASAPCGNRK